MADAGKPYAATRLHNRTDRGWSVTDARGAIVDDDGLCMKLTKLEADAKADSLNAPDPPPRPWPRLEDSASDS